MYSKSKNLEISILFFTLVILSLIFSGCIIEKQDEQNSKESNAIITISMDETFSKNSSINITVNIANKGNLSIHGEGFCYTFLLTYPNGSKEEVFCPFNNSMGVIEPKHYFEQTIDLREFSNDTNAWKSIGNIPFGNYEIYAIYGSENNPWVKSLNFPYERTISNKLNFKKV